MDQEKKLPQYYIQTEGVSLPEGRTDLSLAIDDLSLDLDDLASRIYCVPVEGVTPEMLESVKCLRTSYLYPCEFRRTDQVPTQSPEQIDELTVLTGDALAAYELRNMHADCPPPAGLGSGLKKTAPWGKKRRFGAGRSMNQ